MKKLTPSEIGKNLASLRWKNHRKLTEEEKKERQKVASKKYYDKKKARNK